MNYFDYREKLGIGFDDSTKKTILKNKIINLINFSAASPNVANLYFDGHVFYTYFANVGEVFKQSDCFDINNAKEHERLADSFNREDNIKGIIWKFVILINISDSKQQDNLLFFIKTALSDLKIQYEIVKDEDGYFIFPKGAQELDDKLVSEPLEWLKEYKLSHKAFIKALKDYSEVDGNTASQVADNLRKALETFFQEFFETTQSLENCKSAYGKFMKDKGISSDISNNFETLLQLYTNYNNNNAKHHDKADIKALEYILYQTGAIIRLLITLKQENK